MKSPNVSEEKHGKRNVLDSFFLYEIVIKKLQEVSVVIFLPVGALFS